MNKIGVIGLGFVGSSMYKSFELKGVKNLFGYDKCKDIDQIKLIRIYSERYNIKGLNNFTFRYPGGNGSNQFFWDGNLPSSILNDSQITINNLIIYSFYIYIFHIFIFFYWVQSILS